MACPKTSWHGEGVSRRGRGRLLICAIAGVLACSAVAGAAPDSFPPPGRIVYSKPLGDGRRALFVGRANGSDAVPITAGPNDYNAQWSPDGRRVAFERSVAEDTSAVWVANGEDGSSARELDSDPYAEHPRWSPDGLWIAYQVQTSAYIYDAHRANTTFELWAVRPNGDA